MRTDKRRRPRWLPWLGAIVATAGFCALGIWQVQRAGEKQRLLDSLQPSNRPPLTGLPANADALRAHAYYRLRVSGHWLAARQFLLTNRTLHGRVGADVLTPLVLADGRTLLVDRGWVHMRPEHPPDRPVALEQKGSAQVTGRLWLPQPGADVVAAMVGDAWPRRVVRVDFAAMSQALGRPLVHAIVRVDEPAAWTYRLRNLRPRMGPMRHYGYAFQWFLLAVTVLAVAVGLEWRRYRRNT